MSEARLAVPSFLYGTAWKEDETRRLTTLALRTGFRGIDTANQRKHYHEAAVGEGLANAIGEGLVTREDVYLQTKFTHRRGQDDRLPYDEKAPITTQVTQSFERSLEHLQTTYIDSYVLHGPSTRKGFAAQDLEAWKAMEAITQSGRASVLGISNVTADQLKLLCETATIKPTFVQNRCYAAQRWDTATRAVCREHGVTYQGFSLLTANKAIFQSAALKAIAAKHKRALTQIVFRFALDVGMVALTGTKDADHMAADLAVTDFKLDGDDIQVIESIGVSR